MEGQMRSTLTLRDLAMPRLTRSDVPLPKMIRLTVCGLTPIALAIADWDVPFLMIAARIWSGVQSFAWVGAVIFLS
jgi:hypothetical protein